MDAPGVVSAAKQGSAASVDASADGPAASPLHAAVLSRQPHRVREIFTRATNPWSTRNMYLVMMNWTFKMTNRLFKFESWHWMMMKMDMKGMCAIHVAAKLGYCDIINEFLLLSPECVYIRTSDYKTALHVAIKYNQLEVVQKVLGKQESEEGRKMVSYDHDVDGNTAFHIAVMEKVQPQIVEELLRWPGVNPNAMNGEGLTSLDFALHFARTARSGEASPNKSARSAENSVRIKEILEEVGACRSNSPHSQDDIDSNTLEVDTLVASLIATITFAAIFQVPGGIEEDKSAIQHGAAKLALEPYFKVFLFCDILALFTSLTVVVAWLFRQRMQIGTALYRSPQQIDKRLQYLCALSLGISISCSGIAFLCAAILVVIPPHVKNIKTTHNKEFRQYEGLHLIMTVSVLLPLTLFIYTVYFCFISDYISPRLKNPPSSRQYEIKKYMFICFSGSMWLSVLLISSDAFGRMRS